MNTTTQQAYHGDMPQETLTAKTVRSGSLAEGIAGGAGIVLAIIGLANILPHVMIPISTIALGAALLFEGGAVTARFTDLLEKMGTGRVEISELGVGLTTELVGGLAGIVMGILALLNVSPTVLLPVAAIVFGVTLLFGSTVTARLNSLHISRSGEHEAFREVAQEAVSAAAGVQLLLGLVAITLGILALVGMSPVVMNLIALLCIGFSDLLSGTALSARMLSMVRS